MSQNQRPLPASLHDSRPGAEAATALPPKVSVLIPTYNYARYLPEAIESILEQDYDNFELLISDDCSTDGSAEVIARYAAKDSRIRFHAQPANLGMVQNWNWCLAQARGEFVKFLFGDDKLANRQALRHLVQLLEAYPSATLAASARYVLRAKSDTAQVWDNFGTSGLYRGTEVIWKCLDLDSNLIGEPSAVMFRRRNAAGGFDARYRQLVDLRMWFELLEGGDLAYTPEPLCLFRQHSQQQTEVNRARRIVDPEHLRLFWEYHRKPFLKDADLRSLLFRRIYYAQKRRLRDSESRELKEELMKEIGPFSYAARWIHHKIFTPGQHLQRWLQRRRSQNPGSSAAASVGLSPLPGGGIGALRFGPAPEAVNRLTQSPRRTDASVGQGP